MSVLLLACPNLPEVELKIPAQVSKASPMDVHLEKSTDLELPALKDVAVGAARLSRPAADGSVEAASTELCLKEGIDLGVCDTQYPSQRFLASTVDMKEFSPFSLSSRVRFTWLDCFFSSVVSVVSFLAPFLVTGLAYYSQRQQSVA